MGVESIECREHHGAVGMIQRRCDDLYPLLACRACCRPHERRARSLAAACELRGEDRDAYLTEPPKCRVRPTGGAGIRDGRDDAANDFRVVGVGNDDRIERRGANRPFGVVEEGDQPFTVTCVTGRRKLTQGLGANLRVGVFRELAKFDLRCRRGDAGE